MLQLLLPQENKFFLQLDDLCQCAEQSAKQLKILVENGSDERMASASSEISRIKAQAKSINRNLTREICQTLITPFDREDIQEMSVSLYDIPKLIEKIKGRMLTQHLKDWHGDFKGLAAIIEQGAQAMTAVLEELAGKLNTKGIPEKAALIDELEDQADKLFLEVLTRSSSDIQDTRELMLRRDIYELLEAVTNRYRDAANVAVRIVLKHS